MKAICLLMIFIPVLACTQGLEIFAKKDQEVTLETKGKPPEEEELLGQEVLQKFFMKALKDMDIPKIAIDILFIEDGSDAVTATTSLGYKVTGDVQPYTVQIKRATLKECDAVLEHIAYHELAHIKNGDFNSRIELGEAGKRVIENRAELTAFKMMGWERYKKYWLSAYQKKPELENQISKEKLLKNIRKMLDDTELDLSEPLPDS